jgi:hypothetical protein
MPQALHRLAGAALAATLAAALPATAADPVSAAYSILVINNVAAKAPLRSFSMAEVVPVDPVGQVRDYKTPTTATPECKFTFAFETGQQPQLYQWVGQGLRAQPVKDNVDAVRTYSVRAPALLSGLVLLAGPGGALEAQREFSDAAITSLEFPSLDAHGKDEAAGFKADGICRETRAYAGTKASVSLPARAKGHWLASGYRLTVSGFDFAHASHIAAFTWTAGKTPTLVVTVPAADAASFKSALAHSGVGHDGRLELVGANGQVLFTVQLTGVVLQAMKAVAAGSVEATLVPTNATFTASPAASL